MFKHLCITFLFIVLAAVTFGQEKKSTYKALKLHSFSDSQFPMLSICFDYYSFSDAPDSVSLFENGLNSSILSINESEKNHALRLHYISFYSDTIKLIPLIQKLSLLELPGISSDLVVFDDSVFKAVNPSEWLKNKLPGITPTDTGLLLNLCKTYLPEFHRPDDVFIILSNGPDEGSSAFINQNLKEMIGTNPPFFIQLYEKGRTKGKIPEISLSDSLRIGLSQFDPEKTDPSVILPFINPINNKSRIITWETPDPLSLNVQRNIRVSVNEVSIQLSVFLTDSIIKKFFISSTLHLADSLTKAKEFDSCLRLLNDRYSLLQTSEFVKKAETNLDSLAVNLLSKKEKTPFSSYIEIESTNKLPLSQDYLLIKQKRVKEFYRSVDYVDTFHAERLKIAECLYNSAPEDNETRFILHWSKGKSFDAEKNIWKAIDEYKLALAFRDDAKVRSEIKRLINICMPEAGYQKDWKRIRLYGSRFYDFVQQSFTLRCLYGRACYEVADYQTSISQFEWLVFNWQDNIYLTWEDAFNYLQHAYTLSFRFDEAISLSQRIFREKKNIESLNLALLNLRLKWLKPSMDAFKIWIESVPVDYQSGGSLNLARIGLPQYMLSVMIYESTGSTAGVLFRNTQFKEQNTILPVREETSLAIIFENNYQWLTGRTYNKRLLVFQLDNGKMDDQEKSILSAINKEPANNEVWQKLFAYEEKTGLKSFTQILAALTGSSLQITGSTNVEKYWKAISGNKGFIYISNLKKDGSDYFQKGFERNKSAISEEDLQKSAKTTAFYLMESKYDNNEIFDITNPVFGKSGWEGVLRVGIRKQY